MFINKYPVFKKGNVLEKEDLDLLRDNPLEVLSLMYSDKSNGIIKGAIPLNEVSGIKKLSNCNEW